MFTELKHPNYYMVRKNHLELPKSNKNKGVYNGGVYRWWMKQDRAASLGMDVTKCTQDGQYVLVYVGLASCLRDRLHNKHISHAYYSRTYTVGAKIAVDSYTSRRIFDGKANGYTTSSLVESIAALIDCSVTDERIADVFDDMRVQYCRCEDAFQTAQLELEEINNHVLYLNTKDNTNIEAEDFINELSSKRNRVKIHTVNAVFTKAEKNTTEFVELIESKLVKKSAACGVSIEKNS